MKINRDVRYLSCIGAAMCLPLSALAEDENRAVAWLDQTHESFSTAIGSWSNGLDAYLSGRQRAEVNQSYLSVRFGPIFEEEATTGFFDFNTRIRLPNTQNRLNFIVESDAKQLAPSTQTAQRGADSSFVQSAQNVELAAAIRVIEKKLNATLDAGVLLDLPLDPYTKLQFVQSGTLGDWSWRQTEQLFSYYSLGRGGRYGFSLSNRLTNQVELGGDWSISHLVEEDETAWRENVFLNHSIDQNNKLRYQFSVLQTGWPRSSQQAYLYFVQWQRRLYDKWLIGQVQPQVTHLRSEDYAPSYSLTLSLELLFGEEFL